MIPRFIKDAFEGYAVVDFKQWLAEGRVEVILKPREKRRRICHRCGHKLGAICARYPVKLKALPILSLIVEIKFFRYAGQCTHCKKARAEHLPFIAKETPHMTSDYAFWLGQLCEIAPVSRVAELMKLDSTTLWRVDLERMRRMLSLYRIPEVSAISVDEVYARKKRYEQGEKREARFFTVVSDLNTHRVLWVSNGRSKEALDEFFTLIGKEAAAKITVAAMDQFDGYKASVEENAPQAKIVFDRFHLVQNFEKAFNEARKDLHEQASRGSPLDLLTRGQYRFIFLKKASRRTAEECAHIDEVLKHNEEFFRLELIKERFITLFNEPTADAAKAVLDEIGDWIWSRQFPALMKWWQNFEAQWDTIQNYFTYRVTSALSEGINNVIKSLKRRAFGFRNMDYFKLKILQACGYLNARYIPSHIQLLHNF